MSKEEAKGTAISDLNLNEESAKRAAEIFNQIYAFCESINDDTGVKQVNNLVEFAMESKIPPDTFLLRIIDVFTKYLALEVDTKLAIQQLKKQLEDTPKNTSEVTTNQLNKKLN